MLLTLPILEVLPATPRARIVRLDLGGVSFDYAPGQAVLVAALVARRRALADDELSRPLELPDLKMFSTCHDLGHLSIEVTVDDPGAYTAPWKSDFNLRWEAGTELFEYVCQEANYAPTLMVGDKKSVDRTSSIVP